MTKNEMEIKKIVREAVHETLNGLGISVHSPQEMQADFIYIRKMRKGAEMVTQKIKASLITVTIPTVLYIFWESLKEMLKK
ncbi:MAG: hypothetical protein PQ612_06550 [Rickettsiales bacterium]|nr:hypothetical protein [Pseudomonadota bacterium]MDA0966633.1 hypothetical protein [Pseudomonadota bacterium]MDG4543661.1 hypothetical protein [Rickettsiales bacterium]MDG4545808.1 hypothetical protein [Rickettsiales bacterium]MDG4547418.1 hypothetical protein [Rickettsiales bacterium]